MKTEKREGEGMKWDDGGEGKAGKWGEKGGLAPPSQNLDPPLTAMIRQGSTPGLPTPKS